MYDLDEVRRMQAKLPRRYLDLMRRLGSAETNTILRAYEDLAECYGAVGRHYHTLEHIAHAHVEFDRVAQYMAQPDRVLAALFYHDALDSEVASALYCQRTMQNSRMVDDRATVFEVVRLIRLTETHDTNVVADKDGALCIDIDMSILGVDPVAYLRYRTRVREEYRRYDDTAWASGRTERFLIPTLARPRIFLTDQFESRLGAQARANLEGELAEYRSM